MTDQNRSSASVLGQPCAGAIPGVTRPASQPQPGAGAPVPLSPQPQPPQLQGLLLQNSLRQPLPNRPPLSPLGVNGVNASAGVTGTSVATPNSNGTDSPTGATNGTAGVGGASASKRRPQVQAQVKRPTADQILDYRQLVAQQSQLQMDDQHVAFANIYQVIYKYSASNLPVEMYSALIVLHFPR